MKFINTFTLILFLLLFSYSCDSSFNSKIELQDEKLPKIKSAFCDVVSSGWDKNVREIKEVFPGGKFFEGNLKKRIASQYRMYAELTDIGAAGRLSFSQLEEKQQKNPTGQVIRAILIENQPMEYLEKKFQEICQFIRATYVNAAPLKTKNSQHKKTEHHIYTEKYMLVNFDDQGHVFIGLDLDNSNKWLKIDITHSIPSKE